MHLKEDLIDGENPVPDHWLGHSYCGSCGYGYDPEYDTQEWDGEPKLFTWLNGLREKWPKVFSFLRPYVFEITEKESARVRLTEARKLISEEYYGPIFISR